MINISNKEELRQLILRYTRGQASQEEIYFLHQYYAHFEDKSSGLIDLSESERKNLKLEILGAIDKKVESIGFSRRPYWWLWRVAAVLIFLIVGAAVFWSSPFEKAEIDVEENTVQMTRTSSFLLRADNVELHHYLPDGSYVLLEPGSEISYESGFADGFRKVELEGEAFFDIKHEDDRPFVVLANGVSTRVLGTTFRITSVEEDLEFSISVTCGKVEVSDSFQQLAVLEKNDQMVLDMQTNAITKTILLDEQTAKLEPVVYVMDNISVDNALDIISKRWECEFKVLNPDLYGCEFTTSFFPTDNLKEIVTVISAVIGAKFKIEGKVVTLEGEGCS